MFQVMEEQCSQCLFSKNRIVSLSRMKEILKECATNDNYFVCHKTKEACCRGFYNRDPYASNLMRISARLERASGTKMIEFVKGDK